MGLVVFLFKVPAVSPIGGRVDLPGGTDVSDFVCLSAGI